MMVRHQVALVSWKLTHGTSGVNLPLFGSHYDWVAAAQPWCLAWRRAHADQARPSQATRSVSPWAAPPHPCVPSPAAGEVSGGGRATPVPPRGPARWGVPLTSPDACWAVVVVPGSGRGMA